jgi:DNA-binding MarR family transcriptional regulator
MAREEPVAPQPAEASPAELDMGILADDVGFQVHITRRAIWNALRRTRQDAAPRKPSGYFATLILIGANPGISQTQIAEALVIDLPNVALILRRMTEAGLVEREQDPIDRRRLRLRLTAEGEAQLQSALEFNDSQRRLFAEALTAEESRQLVTLLRKLQKSLRVADRVGKSQVDR